MRPDMAKVIVERPRRGGGKSKGRVKAHPLDGPTKEGIGRPHDRRKSLNENLAPLIRFLESKVGQHWPKVYAEISANLRPVSTVQQHVRDHVQDFIAVKTAFRDGAIVVHRPRFRGGPEKLEESGYRFYVHPVSGVIHRNKVGNEWKQSRRAAVAKTKAAIAARRVVLGPLQQLHKLNGSWFAVELSINGDETRETRRGGPGIAPERDAIRDAGLSALPPVQLYGLKNVRAKTKRQLGSRELARHGLQNDPPEGEN